MWVATKIVYSPTLKARVNALKYFAQTALYCREYKNFNGVTGIVAGLAVAPVSRLHKTWAAFAEKFPKTSTAYHDLAELVSPKGQYGNYRKVLKELTPPAIPFLGVYLTDLTFVELGNPGMSIFP
jgi:son of sevenless-like protein